MAFAGLAEAKDRAGPPGLSADPFRQPGRATRRPSRDFFAGDHDFGKPGLKPGFSFRALAFSALSLALAPWRTKSTLVHRADPKGYSNDAPVYEESIGWIPKVRLHFWVRCLNDRRLAFPGDAL